VWALVETAFWFPSSGGRRSSVHGCGSVHAVVELRKDVREFPHLTGHYHMVRGRYGELKVLVDGETVVDGGTLAAFGVLPSGRKIVEVVRDRLSR
jgi:hypothetical protein